MGEARTGGGGGCSPVSAPHNGTVGPVVESTDSWVVEQRGPCCGGSWTGQSSELASDGRLSEADEEEGGRLSTLTISCGGWQLEDDGLLGVSESSTQQLL
jgi:hypothetical protein